MYDLIVRDAVIVDGLGNEPVKGDVAVTDGRIAAVGEVSGNAAQTIDAQGLHLCPGFVDVHTHYDAQVTWDPTLSPSSSLGVSTVVMGNCGFGIVPCAAPNNETIMENLSVVEGMDLDALRAGVRWEFEDFPGYRTFLERQHPYLNVATLIGHSATRLGVMGKAAASERREPTAEELHWMREVVRTAIRSGAIGFASSFSPNHSGYGGVPMPSTIAEESELRSLLDVLKEEGAGVFQIAAGARATVDVLESLSAESGRPVFMSGAATLYNEADPTKASDTLNACAAATERGHPVYGQVSCQPLSMDFTGADPYPFYTYKVFNAARNVSDEVRAGLYADAAFRQAFREGLANPEPGAAFAGNWKRIIVSAAGDPKFREYENASIGEIAAAKGADPVDVFFDLVLDDGFRTVFVAQLYNADDEGVRPLLRHTNSIVSLSDAGAHLGFLCDAGYGLYFLGHWVRERGDFDLADAVRRLTSFQADLYRIPDRGRIATGAFADFLLFDPKTVGISPMLRRDDMPGGASRTIREPKGLHGMWVNGIKVFDGREVLPMERGPGQVLSRFH